MAKRNLSKAKLLITVESRKGSEQIQTVSVFDNRTNNYWTAEQIHMRGIVRFLNIADLKETLNWNLNGDAKKYYFKWGFTVQGVSTGYAYIFD